MGTVYGYRFMTKLFDVTFFRMGSKSRSIPANVTEKS